jgi:hypothetical protein
LNSDELRARLTGLGVGRRYWIREHPKPDLLPEDVTIMEPSTDGDGWTVYYTERGLVIDQHHFETEGSACDYVLGLATDE